MAKTHTALAILVLCLGSSPALYAQTPNCTQYNKSTGAMPYGSLGTAGHKSGGSHQLANYTTGTCTYSGLGSGAPCDVVAKADSSSTASDNGALSNPIYKHQPAENDVTGTATSYGGQGASASSRGAGAVAQCTLAGCNFSVGFAPVGLTFGGSTPLWSNEHDYTNNCAGRTLPSSGNGCDNSAVVPLRGSVPPPCLPGCACGSPLLIDTKGTGFKMTNPAKEWVTFDLKGDGNLYKLSWPASGSGNAWLVLDSDHDRVIDSGQELFGNFTAHANGDFLPKGLPRPSPSNGFMALIYYDQPSQGGNMDIKLDKQDPIWSKLRLWFPEHCLKSPDTKCVALDSELKTLDSAGIQSISLVYGDGPGLDPYGNDFKFSALVNVRGKERQRSEDTRKIADVWLVLK